MISWPMTNAANAVTTLRSAPRSAIQPIASAATMKPMM